MQPGYPSQYNDQLTSWTAEESQFNSWRGQEVLLLSKKFRRAVEPTQPII
jgi:hypothetical protein